MNRTQRMTVEQVKDEKDRPIRGRLIGRIAASAYIPRILRGSIELPHERSTRAKAEAKRARKAQRRLNEIVGTV